MKKQECALFVVSLIVLLLVWVVNSNRVSAAEYNFFFYGDQNNEKKSSQSPQETSSPESAAANANDVPQHKETAIEKTAAVITPSPVRAPQRFLPLFLLPFLPDDAYFSLGWEHNTYYDKVRSTSDLAQSVLVKVKIAPFLVLDGSIPFNSYNPGVRIFKIGALTEWDPPIADIKLHQSDSEIKRRWKNNWNFFRSITSPSLQLSSGWLYNPRSKQEEHLMVGHIERYWNGNISKRPYRDENRATGLARSNLYLGGGVRFRFLDHIDLTASLNFIPLRKWSHLFSGGASVVF